MTTTLIHERHIVRKMKTKFYLITNKKNVAFGVVKATSYDSAFQVFKNKSTLGDGQALYAEILKPDELHTHLNSLLAGNGLIDLR